MNDPMKEQVGGSHYKDLKIEPFEFSLANRHDGAVHAINKYVTRHAAKNGAEDLRKAFHIVAIRQVQIAKWGTEPSRENISVHRYIAENAIPHHEAAILLMLENWSLHKYVTVPDEEIAAKLRGMIEELIALRYPD